MRGANILMVAVVMVTISSCGMFKKTKNSDKQSMEHVSKQDSVAVEKNTSSGEIKERVLDKGTVVTEKETVTTTTRPRSTTKLTIRKEDLKPGDNILRDSMGREVKAVLDTLQGVLTLDISTPEETTTKTERETVREDRDLTSNKEEKKEEKQEKQDAIAREDRRKDKSAVVSQTTTPSIGGTFTMWISIGISLLIVIVGTIWYIRNK